MNLYISATALLENSYYYGVPLEYKKTVIVNQLFGCPKANSDLEYYAK